MTALVDRGGFAEEKAVSVCYPFFHTRQEGYRKYLYSSDSPNATTISLNSSMTSRAAWSISNNARSSFGFANACSWDRLDLIGVGKYHFVTCGRFIPVKSMTVDAN